MNADCPQSNCNIQICDFVSFFEDLYYRAVDKRSPAEPCQQDS